MIKTLATLIVILCPIILSAQLRLDSWQVENFLFIEAVSIETVIDNSSEIFKSNHPEIKEPTLTTLNSEFSIMKSPFSLVGYQPKHYGVFCRIEKKIEKKSGISPRFRLGSAEYVDWLETGTDAR